MLVLATDRPGSSEAGYQNKSYCNFTGIARMRAMSESKSTPVACAFMSGAGVIDF